MNETAKQRKNYKKFIFGETLKEAIDLLPESERGRFLLYIINYGIDGVEPELAGMEKVVWFQMKTLINNINGGKKEGAPYGNDHAKKCREKPEPEQTPAPQPEPEPHAYEVENNSNQLETTENNSNQLETTENNSNQLETTENKKNNSLYIYNYKFIDSEFKNSEFKNSREKNFENEEQATGPPEKPPNYALEFQESTEVWNDETRKTPLPPFRRDFFALKPEQREIFVQARLNFSMKDIIDAIKNYQFVRDKPEEYFMRHNYASIFTFLEKGVGTFCNDKTIDAQFLREEKKK